MLLTLRERQKTSYDQTGESFQNQGDKPALNVALIFLSWWARISRGTEADCSASFIALSVTAVMVFGT